MTETETETEAGPETADALPSSDLRDFLFCAYYDEDLALSHLDAARSETLDAAAAIVPHYGPAMYMTAHALACAAETPDTVVVIAPNHEGRGEPIQICGRGYYWNGGSIRGDDVTAGTLAALLGVKTTDEAAREDWSASIQMPYIARFFPDAGVVTVLVSRGADPGQLRRLSRLLSEASEEQKILVLGSADFSHYQDAPRAKVCDEETARAIEDGDTDRLLRFGNDHVDSPETVAVLLWYGGALGLTAEQADGLLDLYAQDGKQMAGSYYEYLFR